MTKKFIALEQLRYEQAFVIEYEVKEPLPNVEIAPLLLLPLVENAIKHGENQDPNKALQIRLESTPSHIQFRIRNFKKEKQKDEQGGIGIQNLNKRLQLLYQSELTIVETPEIFEIGFDLKLKEAWIA